jgi:hypothetical protein
MKQLYSAVGSFLLLLLIAAPALSPTKCQATTIMGKVVATNGETLLYQTGRLGNGEKSFWHGTFLTLSLK